MRFSIAGLLVLSSCFVIGCADKPEPDSETNTPAETQQEDTSQESPATAEQTPVVKEDQQPKPEGEGPGDGGDEVTTEEKPEPVEPVKLSYGLSERAKLDSEIGSASALAVSPDGFTLVSGSESGALAFTDLKTGESAGLLEAEDLGVTDAGEVTDLAFLSKGGSLLVGDSMGNLCLCKGDGSLIKSVVFDDRVRRIAVSPDAEHVAVYLGGEVIKLLSIPALEEQKSWNDVGSYLSQGGLSFSPDGKRLAWPAGEGSIKILTISSGEESVFESNQVVNAVRFSDDGSHVIAADSVGRVLYIDAENRKLLRMMGRGEAIGDLLVSEANDLAVSVGDTVSLWNPQTGEQHTTIANEDGAKMVVALNSAGTLLAASKAGDSEISLYDIKGVASAETVSIGEDVDSVRMSPDGSMLVVANGEEPIRVIDVKTGQLRQDITHGSEYFTLLPVSPDGKYFGTRDYDNGLRFWEIETGALATLPKLKDANGEKLAWSVDGSMFASPGYREIELTLVDGGWKKFLSPGKEDDNSGSPVTLTFSGDGSLLITGSASSKLVCYEVKSGKQRFSVLAQEGKLKAADMSPTGTHIVTASETPGDPVRIWSATDGAIVHELKECQKVIGGACFNADGSSVVVLGSAGVYDEPWTMKVFDVKSGKLVSEIESVVDSLMQFEVATDHRRLLIASRSGEAKIWRLDAMGGAKSVNADIVRNVGSSADAVIVGWPGLIQNVEAFEDELRGVAISPDESLVASLGGSDWRIPEDATDVSGQPVTLIKLHDAKTGELVKTLTGHKHIIFDVQFSTDGKKLYTVSRDKTLREWNVETGEELRSIPLQNSQTRQITLSPDGTTGLLFGSEPDTWSVFDVEAGTVKVLTRHSLYQAVRPKWIGDTGRVLMAVSEDDPYRVVNLTTGKVEPNGLPNTSGDAALSRNLSEGSFTNAVAVSRDGKLAAGLLHRYDRPSIVIVFSTEDGKVQNQFSTKSVDVSIHSFFSEDNDAVFFVSDERIQRVDLTKKKLTHSYPFSVGYSMQAIRENVDGSAIVAGFGGGNFARFSLKALQDETLQNVAARISAEGGQFLDGPDKLSVRLEVVGRNSAAALTVLPELKRPLALDLSDSDQLKDEMLVVLDSIPSLVELNLHGSSSLTTNALKHLRRQTGLKKLDISYLRKVDDSALERIRALENLEELHLSDTGITTNGLAGLVSFPKLRILDLGGIDDESEDENVWKVLAGLTELRELYLGGIYEPGHRIKHLGALKNLEVLDLRALRIEEGMTLESISGLEKLRELRLNYAGIDDKALKTLTSLPSLEVLTLEDCDEIRGPGLTAIGAMPKLKDLNLESTGIDDAGVANLSGLTTLESLTLPKNIGDASMEHIKGLTNLKMLNVRGASITDAGIAKLAELKSLEELKLSETRITDKSFEIFGQLPKLQKLIVGDTELTDEAREAFEEAHPGIDVSNY